MNEELNKRIRSHKYIANSAITDFLKNRTVSGSDLTVFERRTSDSTQNVGDVESIDTHLKCLTPVPSNITDNECCICHSLAINPFRCSKPSEIVEEYNNEYSQVYHICCYKCITTLMLIKNSDTIPCPTCRQNEFILDKLIPVSDAIIKASQNLMIYCNNNCGLMGDPIAMSHHICPLSNPKQVGHTLQSNIVHTLSEENRRLNEEISHVLQNYNQKKNNERYWRLKYSALWSLNYDYINQISALSVRLEDVNLINNRLKNTIKENNLEIYRLEDEMKGTIKRCKGKLKTANKVYETKVQELIHEKDLLIKGITKIGSSPLAFETICAQTSQNRENSTDIIAKADNSKLVNFSKISEATVFFRNTAYKLPPYDRESLSIIDLKKMIKNLIPSLDENEYELCYFTYKLIDENEDSTRNTYSVDNPKPLKTSVHSNNPNFVYLPKILIASHNDSMPIVFSPPFATVDQNLSSFLEDNSDITVSN